MRSKLIFSKKGLSKTSIFLNLFYDRTAPALISWQSTKETPNGRAELMHANWMSAAIMFPNCLRNWGNLTSQLLSNIPILYVSIQVSVFGFHLHQFLPGLKQRSVYLWRCDVSVRWRAVRHERICSVADKGVGGARLRRRCSTGLCVRRWWARRGRLLVVSSVRCHFVIRREHALWCLGCSGRRWILVWIWISPRLLLPGCKYGVEGDSCEVD